MDYDDYEIVYKNRYLSDEESKTLSDLYYERDEIEIEIGRMFNQGNPDPVEHARLVEVCQEYTNTIKALEEKANDRQYIALLGHLRERGLTSGDWYFVEIMDEWISYFAPDHIPCTADDIDHYPYVVERFRARLDIPSEDIVTLDPGAFPGFMHMAVIRGNSAFLSRMHGAQVIRIAE